MIEFNFIRDFYEEYFLVDDSNLLQSGNNLRKRGESNVSL
jgi:hypothetical protein